LVDTFGGAATDDLESFGAIGANEKGRIWILRAADPARVVTVKSNALSFNTPNGDFVLDGDDKILGIISQGNDGAFTELFRSVVSLPTLNVDMDAAGFKITDVGLLSLKRMPDLVITAGVVTATDSHHFVDTDDASTVAGIYAALRADHRVAGSMGEAIYRLHADAANKKIANKFNGQTKVFEDDAVTLLATQRIQPGASDDEVELVDV
ncbi:MAG: hypothetical protein IIA33_09930, partial [Planctomycetes bacterium]|nr:hypothetical protein [Planctomycetota bacterium]